MLSLEISKLRHIQTIPAEIGKYTREFDTALPGKHVRKLYDMLKRPEAAILAQLRTGMAHLNGYLARFGAAGSAARACGYAKESVQHSLFYCPQWEAHRHQLQHRETNTGWLSLRIRGQISVGHSRMETKYSSSQGHSQICSRDWTTSNRGRWSTHPIAGTTIRISRPGGGITTTRIFLLLLLTN